MNPFDPPDETLPVERDVPVRGAGFGIRAAARITDAVVQTLTGAGFGCVTGVVLAVLQVAGWITPGWEERVGGLSVIGVVFGIVGDIVYHTVCEVLGGASVGKLLFGLRVVTDTGDRPPVGRSAIRNLTYLLDAQFFGVVAAAAMGDDPLRRRLGDRWSGMMVVHAVDAPHRTRRSGVAFAGAALAGIVATGGIGVVGLVLQAL